MCTSCVLTFDSIETQSSVLTRTRPFCFVSELTKTAERSITSIVDCRCREYFSVFTKEI